MKAVVYQGPFSVSVEEVPDPTIEKPSDAVIRITMTNICAADLHMFEGRTNVEDGTVLGHANMGIVEEVGDAVDRIKVGDRVPGRAEREVSRRPCLVRRGQEAELHRVQAPDRRRRRRPPQGRTPGRAGGGQRDARRSRRGQSAGRGHRQGKSRLAKYYEKMGDTAPWES